MLKKTVVKGILAASLAIFVNLQPFMTVAFGLDEVLGSVAVGFEAGGSAITELESSIIIHIPVMASGNRNNYIALNRSTGTVIPFSFYSGSEVALSTSRLGTFDVVYRSIYFNDIQDHWASSNISFVSARGLLTGTGSDIFNPSGTMTRAMFVQVLANLYDADLNASVSSRFTDVNNDAWYMPAIEWATNLGIVSGVSEDIFSPAANITREQMATMLANYLNHKGYSLPSGASTIFNDTDDISPWAVESVQLLQQAGVLGGRPNNNFDPQGIATRAEAATIFTQLIRTHVNYIAQN